jgi:hypothetical protein
MEEIVTQKKRFAILMRNLGKFVNHSIIQSIQLNQLLGWGLVVYEKSERLKHLTV